MLARSITTAVERALADTPVVLLNGPRQSGKSTLARWLAKERIGARYLSLDDESRPPAACVAGERAVATHDRSPVMPPSYSNW